MSGFLLRSWRLTICAGRLVHQVAEERASAQPSAKLIEEAQLVVVQLHFDGSDTCCVVHLWLLGVAGLLGWDFW
jgi:hypothetical protein